VLNRRRWKHVSPHNCASQRERVLIVIMITIGDARWHASRKLRENGSGDGNDGVHEGATIATISDSDSLREGVPNGVTMQDTRGESGGISRSRGDRSMVQSRLSVRVGGGVPVLAASRRLRRRFRASDGAPTLVSSDGAIGRANSQPPVSRASSLFHPLTLSPPRHTHTCTQHPDADTDTRARTHARTGRSRRTTQPHGGTQTRAPPTISSRPLPLPPSLSLSLTPFLSRSPPTSCEGLQPPHERHERESEFLARSSRLQCVPKHP